MSSTFRIGLALFLQNPFYKIVPEIITSISNPSVKELVKLRESARRRRERGRFFVEGIEDLLTMMASGKEVSEIFYNSSLAIHSGSMKHIERWKESESFQLQELGEDAFLKAAYRRNPDGVVGILQSWDLGLSNLKCEDLTKPILLLDEIEKPGNLGAILRTSEALGAGSVILSEPRVDFFNPNVVRSSRGLLANINLAVGEKGEILEFLEKFGFEFVATSAKADQCSHEFQYQANTVLVFGSESEGLGEFWKGKIKDWIRLKMLGSASSLNLNVSVGCVLNDYNRINQKL